MRDALSQQLVFQQLMLGFLTVGLVVGVAALGVISTRAVVERRQQIGMLRALGFQREMVSWIFLIEFFFRRLVRYRPGSRTGLDPGLPGDHGYGRRDTGSDLPGAVDRDLRSCLALAYAMTLLTTWLPARQACQVTPAEALRYE